MEHDKPIEVARRPGPDDASDDAATLAEARSWEPPCWPTDELASPLPRVANRAVGWRGSLRFLSTPAGPKPTRH